MSNLLIDTCFWYACYEPEERERHDFATKFIERGLQRDTIIVPHPTLYEVINTRFSKQEKRMVRFRELLTKHNVKVVNDDEYKERALDLTFDFSVKEKRPMSFVDMIIRLMLDDTNLKIKALATFNEKDFCDVCLKKNIELISK
ncbi:putative nucleic acid-binding protein, contains PIN domain [Bacteroidales bacterium Barb6XT]|nr:putative nucleic acid-binding protein, contains PIN domain [Bacteroidales bacterium Barb6XT]